jgi:GntP family gluconate:H+ symporter
LAAAATIGADIGLVIIYGLIVAIPTAAAGLIWAQTYAKKFKILPRDIATEDKAEHSEKRPAMIKALAPLLVPIFLITLKSVAEYPGSPLGSGVFKEVITFIGHPVSALMVGVFIAFALLRNIGGGSQFAWVSDGLKNAGVIILITGAGGAFGAVLRATDIGNNMGAIMSQWQVGIILPFIIAAVLKSAQGSSTVAIITTAALVSPLLEPLGLSSPVALALVVLAIGAGSMTVSHLNDSYFWVIAQFSEMETPIALRCHTLASLFQGITAICIILILKWIMV